MDKTDNTPDPRETMGQAEPTFRAGQAEVTWNPGHPREGDTPNLRVPDPWEYQTAERLGRPRVATPERRPLPPYNSLDRPVRPEEYPPPPAIQDPLWMTTTDQKPSRLLPWFIGAILFAILAIAVGAAIMLRDSNKVPAAWPVIGRDPGVDLCVGIANGDKAPTGAEGGKPMTQTEYLAARDAMGKIRNEDVRVGVVAIVDMAWALQASPGLAFGMGGDIATAYGRLTTGCATYGVTLPPMNTATT